jgi:hypothetical protein
MCGYADPMTCNFTNGASINYRRGAHCLLAANYAWQSSHQSGFVCDEIFAGRRRQPQTIIVYSRRLIAAASRVLSVEYAARHRLISANLVPKGEGFNFFGKLLKCFFF